MNSKLYKNTETGELYSIIQHYVPVKSYICTAEGEPQYDWQDDFILCLNQETNLFSVIDRLYFVNNFKQID